MNAAVVFEFPAAWLGALPFAVVLLWAAWRQRRRGMGGFRVATLALLRGGALTALLFLAARPVWLVKEPPADTARSVALLIDRSESMSLEEAEGVRYQQALSFMRERLLPALKAARLPVRTLLFDEGAEEADGARLSAAPKGKRTNLSGAIAEAFSGSAKPPLAVIALTDGIANESADNARALTALGEARVPFIGVGFGSDEGARTLSLRSVEAPSTVATKTPFNVSAQLEMVNAEGTAPFDLLLFRDGQVWQKKTLTPGKGSRTWLENFQASEEKPGLHQYTVQVLAPNLPNTHGANRLANASVRVSEDKELRVLYIQGALTWDYKFVNLALRNDPSIKLTGLTRTSQQSVFRQNVETAGEFVNGFPTTLEELAPFRVVVLSNLRPADLSAPQQEILARFCGELGGGVLMIGGAATFDSSWQGSRLEQLLPVVFSGDTGVQGLDRPFRIQLTEEAVQNPVFQLSDNQPVRESWAQVPTFTQYGRVEKAKPGAQVWILHQTDQGGNGPRILMASERYGAGQSAVLTIQNFWRWRLAKDCEPQTFDRFWRQLFRFLSEIGRQEVAIHLADQELHPDMDVGVTLEMQPNPGNIAETNHRFFVRVEDGRKGLLQEEAMELEPLRPAELRFHAPKPDVYTITVTDAHKAPIGSRSVEIHDVNVEFQNTARDMETLRQWASVSDGLAFKVEECPSASDLVVRIKSKVEEVRHGKETRQPIGMNGWMFALVLGCLGGEWVIRKRWEQV